MPDLAVCDVKNEMGEDAEIMVGQEDLLEALCWCMANGFFVSVSLVLHVSTTHAMVDSWSLYKYKSTFTHSVTKSSFSISVCQSAIQ